VERILPDPLHPHSLPDPLPPPQEEAAHPALMRLDQWMAQNPWHPRFLPFLVYVGLLPIIATLYDWVPATYPIIYTVQCAVVVWLLWRYRQLLPELTLTFHWLSIPVGVFVAVAWIWLGNQMVGLYPEKFAPPADANMFERLGETVGWIAFSLRLVGMSIVVPLFEELFIRSLLLRSLHHFRPTAIGLVQIVQDLPLVGEWLIHTSIGSQADRHPPVFGPQFERTPLGALSIFGVVASTFVFTIHHVQRDWLGCIVCALAYCFLLTATRRKGLGPTCWAHGITNALLWAYTLQTGDWKFL